MGIGIALVMSPMSTAAMNAVSVQKAGVASGVLQMSRMVGASVGVAATGAIFQSKLGSSFNPVRWRPAAQAARATFVDALSQAMAVSGAIALAGAVIAAVTIRAKRKGPGRPPRPQPRTRRSPARRRRGRVRRPLRRRASSPSAQARSAPASSGSVEIELGQRLDVDLAEARRSSLGSTRSNRLGAAGQGVSTTRRTSSPAAAPPRSSAGCG